MADIQALPEVIVELGRDIDRQFRPPALRSDKPRRSRSAK
jgi:hypothetical protein